MKKTKIISMAVLTVVACLLLAGIPVPATRNGELATVDCANPDSPTAAKEIKPSEYLSYLGGGEIGEAEAKYIDSVLDEALIYSDRIPTSKVTVHYDGEKVYLSAASYEYTSASGISVSWIPTSVHFNGEEYPLDYSSENGSYDCMIEFEESSITDSGELYYADVEYLFEFIVDSDDADTFLNYSYRRAVEVDSEIREYELALAASNKYVKYLADKKTYDTQKELYDKYVLDKKAYDTALVKYNKYLNELAIYNDDLEKYLLYKEWEASYPIRVAEYNEYLAKKAIYDELMPKYENYAAVMEKAEKKLAVMENMFLSNSKGQVLYSTLKGPTVGEVLARQDELISIGKVDPDVILKTGEATEKLKTLLGGYKGLTDFYDKYDYYIENYAEIKENIILLYRNLHQLFENEAVYAGIVQKERLNRYVEFVSHLYVLQACMDDGYGIDVNWRIKREYDDSKRDYVYYGYKDVLEACQIPADHNNYDPGDLLTLPEKVEQPVKPEAVSPPTTMSRADEPTVPDAVSEPKLPTKVDEPTKPDDVPYAEEPEKKQYTSVELGIRDAFVDGDLSERTVEDDVKLSFVSICSKLVPIDDRYLVIFYDDDGTTILYRYYANYREIAEFRGLTPSKKATDKYTYTFSGWKNNDGSDAVLGEVTDQETVFYASYRSEINRYRVTWVVDGVETREYYEYGQTPVFSGSTDKAADERTVYTFKGWDKTPEKVTANAVYTAEYSQSDRLYTVTFVIDGESYSEQFKYGEVPNVDRAVEKKNDETYTYTFKGWNNKITAVTEDAEYVAVFDKKAMVEDTSGTPITVTLPTDNENNNYNVSVSSNMVKTDVIAKVAKENNAGFSLLWLSEKCKVFLPEVAAKEFSEKNGSYISFDEVESLGGYRVQLYAAGGAGVTLSSPYSFVVNSDEINEHTKVYLVDENGNETRIPTSYADGAITVKLSKGGVIILRDEYSVAVNDFDGGVAVSDKLEATEGDKVSLALSLESDREVESIKIVGEISGNEYALDGDNSFLMPSEPVNITIKTAERRFTVTFVSDGKVVSTKEYKMGETIECPADPVKEATEEIIYQFLEWDPLFKEGSVVSGDVTYNAVFKELLVEDQKGFVPEEDNRFIVFVVTLLCLFIAFVAAVIVLIVILRKKRKKRSAAKS